MEDTLEKSFALCVDARRELEESPSAETYDAYMECRTLFRLGIIAHQQGELAKLCANYNELAKALVEVWEGMATIDRWLRLENLNSPLPKNFIKELRVPHLGGKAALCGMTHKVQGFDFDQRYSEDARKIWDNTYHYNQDFDREEVRWQ